MHRTQVYLPDDDYRELVRIGDDRGQSMAELVRLAVRHYLQAQSAEDFHAVVKQTYGLWKDRPDTEPSLRDLRRGWGRREERLGEADR